jgi:hypothetical protein
VVARVATKLDASADDVWTAVKRLDTFRYVTRGVLGYRLIGGDPGELHEGMVVRGRLWFFHVLPAWTHAIRIVRVDEPGREILTSENGGPVRGWDHRIHVEPLAGEPERCRYTDEITIRAGVLTPLVWGYVHVIFRYRQARWRRLARTLGP